MIAYYINSDSLSLYYVNLTEFSWWHIYCKIDGVTTNECGRKIE